MVIHTKLKLILVSVSHPRLSDIYTHHICYCFGIICHNYYDYYYKQYYVCDASFLRGNGRSILAEFSWDTNGSE